MFLQKVNYTCEYRHCQCGPDGVSMIQRKVCANKPSPLADIGAFFFIVFDIAQSLHIWTVGKTVSKAREHLIIAYLAVWA